MDFGKLAFRKVVRTRSPAKKNFPVTEYVFLLTNGFRRCQELAVKKMEEVQVERKAWCDGNALKREFKERDRVLVWATCKPNGMSVRWVGLGNVGKKISETNYVVEFVGKKEG